MVYTQENRSIVIDTPLGDNVLLLQGFSGADGLSVPFSFELDLVSENSNIAFQDIIGQNVTVSIVMADGERRIFNGLISRFSQYSGTQDADHPLQLAHYSATMVPWFWLLSRTSDSRIFQNLSIPGIVEQIFTEKGFNDFRMNLHDTYDPKEYCVQYRETDFNFVSRLLEQEGIFYFFEHEQGTHTMVLADSTEEHRPCPGQDSVRYHPLSTSERPEEDVITSLDKTQEITIGKYTVNDFNFTMPATDLKVEVSSQHSLGPGDSDRYEVYDYPAEYNVRSEGDRLANLRMQAEEARITTITGTSTCRAFTSGYRFDLTECYRDEMNDNPYVLTSVNHAASEPVGSSGGGGGASYSNNFTCIPFDVPYRPPLVTPKPMIAGNQTAIVTGSAGEEIHCDEHGRVKVQFHWDREGNRDDKTSCWIRVSQAWAGAGWGAMQIPRIGQEVIVDFLEGDPDQPIITGRVYHGTNKPPYALPGEKTKSTIKSDSSKGGGGSNELRFEDKKGSEEIYLHGQKDWTIAIENDKNQTVGNDETLSVGNDRTKTVGNNQKESIGTNKTIDVGSNHEETIGADKTLKVGSNHTETIGSNMSETIGSNMSQTVGSNKTETISIAKTLTIGAAYQVSVGAAMNETIGAAKAEEIGAAKSVNVGAASSENVGANKSVNAGGNISESAGKDVSIQAGKDASISSGKKMSLSAGDDYSVSGQKKGVINIKDQLTIKVGKASITLKKNGDIIIDGKKINMKGSGDIVMKAKKILEN